MKASKFSDAQKAFILKQGAAGMAAAEICRKARISRLKKGPPTSASLQARSRGRAFLTVTSVSSI